MKCVSIVNFLESKRIISSYFLFLYLLNRIVTCNTIINTFNLNMLLLFLFLLSMLLFLVPHSRQSRTQKMLAVYSIQILTDVTLTQLCKSFSNLFLLTFNLFDIKTDFPAVIHPEDFAHHSNGSFQPGLIFLRPTPWFALKGQMVNLSQLHFMTLLNSTSEFIIVLDSATNVVHKELVSLSTIDGKNQQTRPSPEQGKM